MPSVSRDHNALLQSESVASQEANYQHFPRRLWRKLCCRRRTSVAEASSFDKFDRSSRAPAHSQVLPDFVVRMAAPYLRSTDMARLLSVDRPSCNALQLPGLVNEMALLQGIEENRLKTLPQLHLEEEMFLGANIVNFEFMSTDIDEASETTLDHVAKLLRKHPLSQVSIEAHAQPGAPPDIAKSISRERGNVVALELRRRKVDGSRLHMEGYGTTRRLQGGSDRVHRRAEIFISLGGAQFPGERLPFTQTWNSSDRFAAWAAAADDSD